MNDHFLNYYTISLLIGGFTALVSGIVVLIHDSRGSENRAWFAVTMFTSIWSFAFFFLLISETYESAKINNLVLHYAAIYIPLFYYVLVLTITNTVNKNRKKLVTFTGIAVMFTYIAHSSFFVADVVPKAGFQYHTEPGPLYIYFFLYFVAVILFGLIDSISSIYRAGDEKTRTKLTYTVLFTVAATIGGGSSFLTNYFSIPPYPIMLFSLFPLISGYAIYRHRLFDVKMVMTQVFMSAVWILIFIRTLLSESSRELQANIALLVVTIIVGVIIMRSIRNEMLQKEKIQELDELKSKFISLATHHISSPLTAIKGYVSILEEEITDTKHRSTLTTVHKLVNNLVTIIRDFLDVSKLENGDIEYTFSNTDLGELLGQVVAEYRPQIERSGLKVSYTQDLKNKCIITADREKIRQAIGNIIENSIRYTKEGNIDVSLYSDGTKCHISITDTGIRHLPNIPVKLFTKFTRSGNQDEANIIGNGLGLFVAKQLIEAHHGSLKIGPISNNNGWQFNVELSKTEL